MKIVYENGKIQKIEKNVYREITGASVVLSLFTSRHNFYRNIFFNAF